MNLLDLLINVGVQDDASKEIDNISNNTISKLVGAAKTAAKALAAMWAVKKVYEFGKAAFDAYAEYEQLWGGVQKLYGNANMSLEEYAASVGKTVDEVSAEYARNARAEQDMLNYATNAWRTAGMDMNTYMQNATSFSAALINSLGGDTVKAAEMTDRAMTAISDNVNTFGSDMEFVTNAFMGFSRQNYTMLDNLKLGYAGTKQGMEQLIADANEWGAANGEAADLSIDSFADVVTAIEYIQKKQGIYGTTMREALSTIEGSVNATKAAWSNLVAEFGKPEADIGARINDMFTAVFGVEGEGGLLNNVLAEVAVVGENMVAALTEIIPTMLATVPDSITSAAPDVLASGMELFGSILTAFADTAPQILSALGDTLVMLLDLVAANVPNMLDGAGTFILSMSEAIGEKLPEITEALLNLLGQLVQYVIDHGPEMLDAAVELLTNLGTGINDSIDLILAAMGDVVSGAIGSVTDAVGRMLSAGIEFVGGLLDGSTEEGEAVRQWFADLPDKLLSALGDVGSLLWNAGSEIINGLWDGLRSAWGGVTSWVSGLADTIASLKGPLPYDRKVLVENGLALMGGLKGGLEEGFEDEVEPYLKSLAGDISGDMTFSANADYNKVGARGAVVNNYYIDGNLVAADAQLAAALGVVAQRVSGRRRMGATA